ncbi:MAG: agmatine deiminase family protein [Planctomycetota bacterium]|nr:MAG: agmatine deiminase family protein [Planctomycetota bacterium]
MKSKISKMTVDEKSKGTKSICAQHVRRFVRYLIIGGLVFIAGLAVLGTHRQGFARTTLIPELPRIIPDTGGPIAEVALHYLQDQNEKLYPAYRDLFMKLPNDIRILVLCQSRKEAFYFNKVWSLSACNSGREVKIVNVDKKISPWARDRYIARQYLPSFEPADCFVPIHTNNYEAESEFYKINELGVFYHLCQKGLRPPMINSYLHLEGGNVVSNNRHVFIGSNVLSENKNNILSDDLIEQEIKRIVGSDYILIEDSNGIAPYNHADMYITPIDDQTVFIADIVKGLSLLRKGDTQNQSTSAPQFVLEGMMNKARLGKKFTRIARKLDSVASGIEALGYRIVRLPIIIEKSDPTDWIITYNNVLMEHRGNHNVVYMPIYKIPALDQAAQATYHDLGFEVRTVDVSELFHLGGAVRCLVNVTARKPHKIQSITLDNKDNS